MKDSFVQKFISFKQQLVKFKKNIQSISLFNKLRCHSEASYWNANDIANFSCD